MAWRVRFATRVCLETCFANRRLRDNNHFAIISKNNSQDWSSDQFRHMCDANDEFDSRVGDFTLRVRLVRFMFCYDWVCGNVFCLL